MSRFWGAVRYLGMAPVAVALATVWPAWAEDTRTADAVTLPLAFHVAQNDGGPVVDQGFLDAHVGWANEVFARYGVRFALRSVGSLDGTVAMETREDRDSLAVRVHAGVINCFVVASLRDVDEPERMRRGVHWHSTTASGVHYVILSAMAEPFVLAHELGHFLGNARHSHTPGNLMSYTRRPELPFLDAAQQNLMKRRLQRYLREGELVPVLQSP